MKKGGVRDVALDLLCEADHPGTRVDERLRTRQEEAGLDARDRAFVREMVFGTLRWRGRLDGALGRHLTGRADKLPPAVRNILRLAAYQILFADRVPDWAAVDEAVEQTRRAGLSGLAGLVNGVLRHLARDLGERETEPDSPVENVEGLAAAESHPIWMVRRWVDRWGLEAAARICRANNHPALLTVRVNGRRCTPGILREALEEAGAEVGSGVLSPDVLCVQGGPPVQELPGFRQGWFSVQDEAAAWMAPLLGVRPGERVWDACAGPGGKTVHLAELLEEDGIVLATDRNAQQLSRVVDNTRRMGLKSICLVRADVTKTAVREGVFDAVLVDAPCSGLGVLRRYPEAKWNRTEDDLLRLSGLEETILRNVSRAVRHGGRLLYCVCSNEEEETSRVAEAFEASGEGADFERDGFSGRLPPGMSGGEKFIDPEGCFSIRPGDAGTDGFFAVRWRRAGRGDRRSSE